MWGTTIHVGYLPDFSEETTNFIKNNCSPSLKAISDDKDLTNQYYLEHVEEKLVMIHDEMTNQDCIIIEYMKHEGITYIEL